MAVSVIDSILIGQIVTKFDTDNSQLTQQLKKIYKVILKWN